MNGYMRYFRVWNNKVLTDQEILDTIGKGSSYLRKCSDPDLPQQIDHNDSLKLDIACIKKHKAPPLLNSHEYTISLNADNFELLDVPYNDPRCDWVIVSIVLGV